LINPFTLGAAAAGALALAYSQGSREADEYAKSIIMSGNAAGVSKGQLADYAREITKGIGTQANAAEALAALASTGEVSAKNMQEFGAATVAVQKYIGIST
jgi:phage-related minor tail protein